MADITNFYDNMDLKYPEIGIAMQPIDRTNPGKVKFIIPILTPNQRTNKATNETIRLNKRNLMNSNETPIEIENVSVNNYILIPMSKEVCGGYNVPDMSLLKHIESGSKWIIVFVGGDVTKPQVIGRYME